MGTFPVPWYTWTDRTTTVVLQVVFVIGLNPIYPVVCVGGGSSKNSFTNISESNDKKYLKKFKFPGGNIETCF